MTRSDLKHERAFQTLLLTAVSCGVVALVCLCITYGGPEAYVVEMLVGLLLMACGLGGLIWWLERMDREGWE